MCLLLSVQLVNATQKRLRNKNKECTDPYNKKVISFLCIFCSPPHDFPLSISVYVFDIGLLFQVSLKQRRPGTANISKILILVFLWNINGLNHWYSTFFPPVPLETLFHSTLYPQSCWCIIQVIHNYI
jgi:hypothetical protein